MAFVKFFNRVYWTQTISKRAWFSSPSLAVYHLEKILDLGLVKKNSGEYQLKEIVDVGILKQFMKWKGVIIPRYVTYATMISTLLIFFLTQFRQVNFYSLFALIFGSLSTAIFWFETFRIWKSRPKKID